MAWSKRHGEILQTFLSRLDDAQIRFFIIRNYEGLPFFNNSKDVDIVLKHGTALNAEKILKDVFRTYNLCYYYRVRIEESLLCRAVSSDGYFAIHIDLMNGYINRGVEVIPFEELYQQTKEYNGFRVLNDLYNGIMLFIYKQFGYKRPVLKKDYQDVIYNVWASYPEFSMILSDMVGKQLYNQVYDCIKVKDFDKLLSYSREIDKRLRDYSYRKDCLGIIYRKILFLLRKTERILIKYRKYEKSFSVMAPDGTGKTTFLNHLLDRLAWIYVEF